MFYWQVVLGIGDWGVPSLSGWWELEQGWGLQLLRSDGAVFSISPVTVGDKYMDIYSWKTLSNKSRLKDLCFKRRIITVCNGTKRGFHFGTEVGW